MLYNCEYSRQRKLCKTSECCFMCLDKCSYESDRCFSNKNYRLLILKGYPSICRFLINDSEED